MRMLIAIIALGTTLGATPAPAAETITTTTTYSVSYKNLSSFKRLLARIFVKNHDFLDWKEMKMTLTYSKDPATAAQTITRILITNPKGHECFLVQKDSESYSGHMDIDVPADLTPKAAEAYLNIWNYFLDDRPGDLRIDVEPISPQSHQHNYLHCILQKHRDGDHIVISGVSADPKKRSGKAEAVVRDGHPRILEMTVLEVKGVKIILTRKPQ